MSIKKTIFKDVFFYSVSTFFSQALLIIKNFLIAAMLLPAAFGFWKFLQLLTEYGTASSVALIEGSRQKIPIYNASKDMKNSNYIRDITFTFSVLTAVVYSIISLLFYWLIFNPQFAASKGFPDNLPTYLFYTNILIVFTIIYTFFWRYLSSINDFAQVSRIKAIVGLVDFTASIILVYRFKVMGLIFALILTYCLATVLIIKKDRYRPSFNWNLKEALSLIYLGLPIFSLGFAFQLLTSIDRIVIIKFLDNKQLGLYGISLIAFNMFTLASIPLSHVVFPRMIEEYSLCKHKISENFKKYIIIPSEIIAFIIPAGIAFVYFFAPLVIERFLPLYANGVRPMIILVIAALFIGLLNIFTFALVTIRRYSAYFVFSVLSIILNLVLSSILVQRGFGLEGIAFSSLISYGLLTTFVIYYMFGFFNKELTGRLILIAKLYIPLCCSLVFCWSVNDFLRNFHLFNRFIRPVIGFNVFLVLYCIFIYFFGLKKRFFSDFNFIFGKNIMSIFSRYRI